jgi:serine/threonine protein kinase
MRFWKKGLSHSGRKMEGGAHVPERLGGFAIEGELGNGAMGTVYLGSDLVTGRKAAIKTIRLADVADSASRHVVRCRFLHEAKVLTWLEHPNIVAIYDVGEEHGLMYIAMEFVHGVELTKFSEPGNLLPPPTVLEIGERVAEALGAAHEQNVVHCDVKPSNLLYDAATNTVKITDFGIARMVSLAASRTRNILGSAPYMSPEQVTGKPVGGTSDLFSLGSTLYKLLTGRLPFDADSSFDMFSRIVQDQHTDILLFNPDLPPCMRDIINRALAKRPEERFQTGSEMADAIRRCAQHMQHV